MQICSLKHVLIIEPLEQSFYWIDNEVTTELAI